MSQTTITSKNQQQLAAAFEQWMTNELDNESLANKLGVTHEWVDQFSIIVQRYQSDLRQSANNKVEMIPLSVGQPVESEDEIVAILDRITIQRLFTDRERLETREQEGTLSFDVNGQGSVIAWKRPLVQRFPRVWGPLDDTQKRLLYAGAPKGFLDFDIVLEESDEPEREFFARIAELLKSAAAITGLIPAYGTAISAALGLGAAIAQLIKAQIDDDAELRFVGTLGGEDLPLKYGTYLVKRNAFGGSQPEIEITIRIEEFVKEELPTAVTILLDRIEFQSNGGRTINNLRFEDRIVSDLTITKTPAPTTNESSSGSNPQNNPKESEQKSKPTVKTLKIDRPYSGENQATWNDTFKVQEKLLYDGEWGINLAFNVNISGVPREVNDKEWMAVINQTSALVTSLVSDEQQESVRRGFEIAEAARSTVVKFLPTTRFVASTTSLLFVGQSIDGLYHLNRNESWQNVPVTLNLGNYGFVQFHLKVKLAF